jgi:hypothetical protein
MCLNCTKIKYYNSQNNLFSLYNSSSTFTTGKILKELKWTTLTIRMDSIAHRHLLSTTQELEENEQGQKKHPNHRDPRFPIHGRWGRRWRRRRDRVGVLVVPREPRQHRVWRWRGWPRREPTVRWGEARHHPRRCQLVAPRRRWRVAAAKVAAGSCWRWRWGVAVRGSTGGWRRQARVRAVRRVRRRRRAPAEHGDQAEEDGRQEGSRHGCVSYACVCMWERARLNLMEGTRGGGYTRGLCFLAHLALKERVVCHEHRWLCLDGGVSVSL